MVPFHFSIRMSSPSSRPYEQVPSPIPFSPFSSSSSKRNERGTLAIVRAKPHHLPSDLMDSASNLIAALSQLISLGTRSPHGPAHRQTRQLVASRSGPTSRTSTRHPALARSTSRHSSAAAHARRASSPRTCSTSSAPPPSSPLYPLRRLGVSRDRTRASRAPTRTRRSAPGSSRRSWTRPRSSVPL